MRKRLARRKSPLHSVRTSKEIYDRIHWDPGYDERWFAIGYHDREAGLVEVPFTRFVPDGEIPWHRVQRFSCGNTVVWDRPTGLDLVASLRVRPQPPRERADPRRFSGRDALWAHLRRPAPAWVPVQAVEGYPGFLEEPCVHAIGDGTVRLAVEWRSYAMDWMGDATHVGVEYGFASLDVLLLHLQARYGVGPTDMTPRPPPLPPSTPFANGYPEALVGIFQDAWRRLRADFRADRLLTPKLTVVARFDGF